MGVGAGRARVEEEDGSEMLLAVYLIEKFSMGFFFENK